MENGKKYSSSEAHIKSLKTRRGSYLEMFIYVKYVNSISLPSPF
jgi:hypothetical protein